MSAGRMEIAKIQKELDRIWDKTLMHSLGIELSSLDKNCVKGKMPVDMRTHRPQGFLHGGANSAFAESLASIGAFLHVNPQTTMVMGIEINANFLQSVKEGWVFGEAKPLHIGKRTQVWSIHIFDEKKHLICSSRCTLLAVEKSCKT